MVTRPSHHHFEVRLWFTARWVSLKDALDRSNAKNAKTIGSSHSKKTKTLQVRQGGHYDPGTQNRQQNLLEILFLLAFQPTESDARSMNSIAESISISYNGPTRTACITFTSTDIFLKKKKPVEAIGELETVLESAIHKRSSSQCLIVADEITSWMVMEMHVRSLSARFTLPRGMEVAGFFYLECREHHRPDLDPKSARISTLERELPGITASFLSEVFDAFKKIEVDMVDRRIPPGCHSELVLVNDHPSKNRNNFQNIKPLLETRLDQHVQSAFGRKTPPGVLAISSEVSMHSTRTDEAPAPRRHPPQYDSCPSNPDIPETTAALSERRSSIPNNSMSQLGHPHTTEKVAKFHAEDSHPHTTERIVEAFIQDSQPKRALSVLTAYKNESGSTQAYSLSMRVSHAVALLYIGHLTDAGNESWEAYRSIQTERKHTQTAKHDLRDFEEEALYRHTDALFHLGHYDDILARQSLAPLKKSLLEVKERRLSMSDADSQDESIASSYNYEIMAMEISLEIALAKIRMLRGDYETSLRLITSTLERAVVLLGENDMWTLQAALDTCHIQILTSNVTGAADLAHKSMATVSRHFGAKSLLAIEGESTLISVYEAEGRLDHALDSAKELCAAIDSNPNLEPYHIQSLRCKGQLGRLHIRCGNFKEAEAVLQSAYSSSSGSLWRSEHLHPMIPAIRSDLALAQYHLGKIDIARRAISWTLKMQLEEYERISRQRLWDGVAADLNRGTLQKIRCTFEDNMRGDTREQTHMLHPDLLNTLLSFAKIEASSKDIDVGLVVDALHVVREAGMKKLGESNELTLDASISLGKILSSIDTRRKAELQSFGLHLETWDHGYYFDFVVGQAVVSGPTAELREGIIDASTSKGNQDPQDDTKSESLVAELIGVHVRPNMEPYHPTILRSIQESIAADIILGERTQNQQSPMSLKEKIEIIIRMQETRPGWDHPDRLRSMLILLVLQISSNDSFGEIERTCEDLCQRLKKPEVRSQRLVSCLNLEEVLARLLVARIPEFEKYVGGLLGAIADDCEKYLAEQEDVALKETLKGLRYRCQSALLRLQTKDQSSEDKVSDPDDSGVQSGGTSIHRKAAA
ncbi:hypothetical protein CMUS01_05808 [Colletotrichum musicola]|uniref:MalT-like TPR region domain-containing protein n=1 Tax=Colletotrichum musicola TaxID=2175873 RepID=A0A8H6KPM5_9PEZI|nr:hypothetical protein CMUS01_05808 [Colletotrichum musicola]